MAAADLTLTAAIDFNLSQIHIATAGVAKRIERDLSLPLGSISTNFNKFERSLDAATARVLAFGASASVLFSFLKGTTALVSSVIQVEKALTDINVILQTTDKGLARFGNDLFKIARDTGQSFDTVSKAALEFSRQGLGLEQTLKRTRDALILTRLSGLDVNNSVEALTAAVNSFSNSLLSTTQIVNKLARVDAEFAVSSADLAEAIKRVGSSAEDVGVSFDQLIALVTTVKQITGRDGPVIGNALKTIFTRVQRSETLEQLEMLGVAVKDATRETLPALSILESLAQVYDKVGKAQRAQIAEQVGGVYQINILKAALKDLSKENSYYSEALRTSETATNEAIVRSLELNKTLSAQINRLKEGARSVAGQVGNLAVEPALETLLKIGTTVLGPLLLKEGEDQGISFGKAFLKGFGQFFQIGGAFILARALGNIAKRFGGDTLQAFRSLIGIQIGPRVSELSPTILRQITSRPLQLEFNRISRLSSNLTGPLSPAGNIGDLNAFISKVQGKGLFESDFNKASSLIASAARAEGANPAQLRHITGELKRYREEREKLINQAVRTQNLITPASQLILGRAERQRLSRAVTADIPGAREAKEAVLENRLNRAANFALLGSILAPGITSLFSQGLPQTRMGRITEAGVAGIGSVLSTGLLGFGLTKTPIGAAAGGGVGMLAAIMRMFSALNTIFPEMQREATQAADALSRVSERLAQLTVLTQQVSDIRANNIIPTKEQLGGLGQNFAELISGFSGYDKTRLMKAVKSGDVTNIQDLTKLIQEPLRRRSLISSFKQNLSGFIETGQGGEEVLAQAMSLPAHLRDEILFSKGEQVEAFTLGDFAATDRGKKLLEGIRLLSKEEKFRFGQLPADMAKRLGALSGVQGTESAIQFYTQGLDILGEPGQRDIRDAFERLARQNPERFVEHFTEMRKRAEKNLESQGLLRDLETKIGGKRLAFPVEKQIFQEGLRLTGAQFFGESQMELNRRLRRQDISNVQTRLSLEGRRGILSPLDFISKEGGVRGGEARADIFNQIREINVGAIQELNEFIDSISDMVSSPTDIEKFGVFRKVLQDQTKGFRGAGDVSGLKGLLGSLPFNIEATFGIGVQEKIDPKLTQLILKLEERIRNGEELNEKERELIQTTDLWVQEQRMNIDFARLARMEAQSFEQDIKRRKASTAEFAARGLLFSDELAGRNLEDRIGNILLGGTGGGTRGITSSFLDPLKYDMPTLFRDLHQAAADIGLTLKSSFRDAFKTFLDGSQSASDALRSLGLSFANKLLDIAATGTTNLLFGGLQSLTTAAFPSLARGARGGYVAGGSGIRDDIPMTLNQGDYVLRKSSVSKYGLGFLGALNFANGGGVNFTPSSPLSNFALSDENNPQNRLRIEREADDLNALLQYQNALTAYDTAKKQRRLGALINVGFALAGAGIATGADKLRLARINARGPIGDFPQGFGTNFSNVAASGGLMTSFGVQRLAGGGSVDNVPALLTGGEFVMNRGTVSRLGVGFMHRLNRGEIPAFNTGGFVGEAIEGGGNGRDSGLNDSISRLINSQEKLRTTLEKGGSNREEGAISVQPLVGSISINVTMDANNNVKADVKTEGNNRENNRSDRGVQLAELIKSTVLETIIDHSRNGGVLEQNFQRRRMS